MNDTHGTYDIIFEPPLTDAQFNRISRCQFADRETHYERLDDSSVRVTVRSEKTLYEAIAARGWASRKENDEQLRTIYDAQGNGLGSFTAEETWEYLHQTGAQA